MFLQEDDSSYLYVREKSRQEEELEEKLDHAADFLSGVLSHLYSKQPIDLLDLERDLDELCHALGVELIPGDLQIQRKKVI